LQINHYKNRADLKPFTKSIPNGKIKHTCF